MLTLYFLLFSLICYLQLSFLLKTNFSLDKSLNKVQAVHKEIIPRSGGIVLVTSILLTFLYLYIYYDINYLKFYPFLILIFFIGFIDDYGLKIKPSIRFVFLFIITFLFFYFFELKLRTTGIGILDSLINTYKLEYLVISICFLILINGSNFIDGVNGNLSIHYILILIIIFLSSSKINEGFKIEILSIILCFIIFLYFNLKNKIFFGDGGAYVSGAILGIHILLLMNIDTFISPFFYIIITVYLGSEVLVSFLRRVIKKKSAVVADFNHLHSMLFLVIKDNTNLNPHIFTTLTINLIYTLLVFPSLFFLNDFDATRNYSIFVYMFFIIFYLLIKKIYTKLN